MRASTRLPDSLRPNALASVHCGSSAGGSMLDLTVSNPTVCGFEYPAQLVREALSGFQVLTYAADPQGDLAAREAVAAHHGHGVASSDIVLAASTSEAYSWLFKLLCDPGDEVLVPSPSYPLFEWLARLEGIQVRTVPSYFHERWTLDLDALAQAVSPRVRAVVLVNPNNPTGQFLSKGEWRALVDLCTDRDLALIVDEVFGDYVLEAGEDRQASALADPAPPCPVFVLSGLSKTAALPQVKLGWMILRGPGRADSLERILFIADQYLSVSASAQAAAPALLALAPAMRAQILARARANLRELDRRLVEHPHLSRLPVEGGWSILLRRPALGTDEDCALRLLREGRVRVQPGHFFDLPGEGYLVLSLLPPEAGMAAGLDRLLPLLRT